MNKTCGVFKLTPTDYLNSGRAFVTNEKFQLNKCPDHDAYCLVNFQFTRLKELNQEEFLNEMQIDPDLSNCQELDFSYLRSLDDISRVKKVPNKYEKESEQEYGIILSQRGLKNDIY